MPATYQYGVNFGTLNWFAGEFDITAALVGGMVSILFLNKENEKREEWGKGEGRESEHLLFVTVMTVCVLYSAQFWMQCRRLPKLYARKYQ